MRKRLFNALILIFMLAFISACSPDGGEEGNMGDRSYGQPFDKRYIDAY